MINKQKFVEFANVLLKQPADVPLLKSTISKYTKEAVISSEWAKQLVKNRMDRAFIRRVANDVLSEKISWHEDLEDYLSSTEPIVYEKTYKVYEIGKFACVWANCPSIKNIPLPAKETKITLALANEDPAVDFILFSSIELLIDSDLSKGAYAYQRFGTNTLYFLKICGVGR